MPWLIAHWQRRTLLSRALWPLSLVYRAVIRVRRTLFRRGWLATVRLPVPVIVVGNLTVGGSGKTPLVIWLARWLRAQGHRPGIVSRGYGGQGATGPSLVTGDADPAISGDEPLLLARRSGCPVVVDRRRPRGAQDLVARGCTVILSDDGLQHYGLGRDMELVVVDGERRFGNGYCLPAGPLREPRSRLRQADLVIVNGHYGRDELGMDLQPAGLYALCGGADGRPVALPPQAVHAVAGIGHPPRFFATLRALGFEPIPHPFPDHHRYTAEDLRFEDDRPVIMTEKDAVKCQAHCGRMAAARERFYYLAVDARPGAATEAALRTLLTKEKTVG